ncbi:hypothetical protein BU16DRAFT_579758 [Lophium mytilinum]|uniref:Uncharacterized protein n=1 Tax=Lophium mytilinum TaxID=390894 RepID=A0A6A6R2U0_9PEZI|nr:hypothetical protein BU16DRAFT_579758 [Lophium mytilinum]
MSSYTRTNPEHWASEASSDTSSLSEIPTPSMSSNDWTDTDSSDSMAGTVSDVDDDDEQSQNLPNAVTEAEAESTGSENDKPPFLDKISFQVFPASLTRRMGIMPCPATVADVEAAEVLASDPVASPFEPSSDAFLKPYADLIPSERRYRYLLRAPAILWLFVMSMLGIALLMLFLVLLFAVVKGLWEFASGIFMLAACIVMVVCNALCGILGWFGAKLGGIVGLVTTDAVSPV